jgi:hypothetical protein
MRAQRDVPGDPADSGWQFLCGAKFEDQHQAQVWAVEDVLAQEPSLASFINQAPGVALSRGVPGGEWAVSRD